MIVLALIIVAGVLAAVDELRSNGQDLTDWAVLFLVAAALWGRFQ